jgi:hypothetical protein
MISTEIVACFAVGVLQSKQRNVVISPQNLSNVNAIPKVDPDSKGMFEFI